MAYGPYPWATPYRTSTSAPIARQTEATYLDYEKIKQFEDVGYFLNPYVVSGGVVTKNIKRNDQIDITKCVAVLNDDVQVRDKAEGVQLKNANSTYYVDFYIGDFWVDTTHPTGISGVDYLTLATVTTDSVGNVDTITDTAGDRGGFRLKPDFWVNNTISPVINVKGFGAKGDGTDETTILQVAIDAAIADGGKTVFFPPGTYAATALSNLDEVNLVGDNATLTVNGDTVVVRQLEDYIVNYDLRKIMQSMANGEAVTIDCRGDSTMYGNSFNGSFYEQVPVPPPTMLQYVLRSYYNNNNITVLNNGVNGAKTSDLLLTWNEDMYNSDADIVYMNYGINDAQYLTPEEYRRNLIYLVKVAQMYNKMVVLMTPLSTIYIEGGQGSVQLVEKIKQFADIMSEVSIQLGTGLVDTHELFYDYLAIGFPPSITLNDGVHPDQDGYIQMGMQMAYLLVNPNIANTKGGNTFIHGVSGATKYYGGSAFTARNTGSKSGNIIVANKVVIPVYISQPSQDIYIGTAVWNQGTTAATITINNSNLSDTISMNDANWSSPYIVDQNIRIAQNVRPGFYFIEIKGNGNENVGFYYLETKPTNKVSMYAGPVTDAPVVVNQQVLENAVISVTGSPGGRNILFDNVTMDRYLSDVHMRLTGILQKGDGFIIFANRTTQSTDQPRGGIYIYLDSITGYLSVAEGTSSGFTNNQTIGSTDLSSTEHVYSVFADQSGYCNIYVDDVLIGTVYQTQNIIGGYFGVYKYSTDPMTIKSLGIYNQ